MSMSDLIAVISLVVTIIIAIIGGLYAIINNTKKFELSEQYKNELLTWYGKVIFTISKLQGECTGKERTDTLQELSALIEIGRFYFPNIDKKDGFGKEKPCAYQGYRHVALDFLILIYEMGSEEKIKKCREKIEYMERHFTSIIFKIVSPNKRIKNIKQYTKIVMPDAISIIDFMDSEDGKNSIDTVFEYYN
ncbi:MAG: hypothetical protein HDR19_03190 [Lachnospiraceae bacterium]|nr:hypothetical protein [Lachnospiraceae bacterium]